jgi:hypothetical protein
VYFYKKKAGAIVCRNLWQMTVAKDAIHLKQGHCLLPRPDVHLCALLKHDALETETRLKKNRGRRTNCHIYSESRDT